MLFNSFRRLRKECKNEGFSASHKILWKLLYFEMSILCFESLKWIMGSSSKKDREHIFINEFIRRIHLKKSYDKKTKCNTMSSLYQRHKSAVFYICRKGFQYCIKMLHAKVVYLSNINSHMFYTKGPTMVKSILLFRNHISRKSFPGKEFVKTEKVWIKL